MLFRIRMLLLLKSFGRFKDAGDVIFDTLYDTSHKSCSKCVSVISLLLILSMEEMGPKAWWLGLAHKAWEWWGRVRTQL